MKIVIIKLLSIKVAMRKKRVKKKIIRRERKMKNYNVISN